MKITNLSQLKKVLNEGAEFKIIEHFVRPECNGQIRLVTKKQSNGFYSVVKDDPENRFSKANGGLGSWCEFGKSAEWLFLEHAENVYTCTLTDTFEIEVIKEAVL